MAGVPPVLPTDAEDVAWALQTADALWKRGEHADAIVWLRRAAQSAGDVLDDDRAFALARIAADLADLVGYKPVSETKIEVAPAISEGDVMRLSSSDIEIRLSSPDIEMAVSSDPVLPAENL